MSAGLMSLIFDGATHAREQGKINANRVRLTGANKLKASNASLNQWLQSYDNQRRMKASGEQVTNISENIARNLDAASFGRSMSRLAAAEALGADIASSAAAGVGGTSTEMFASTSALTQALSEEQEDRGLNTDYLNAIRAKGDAIAGGVEGNGNQFFSAGLDYTQFINHKKMNPLRKYMTFQLAAGATYFGGPQAGAAVLDFADGQMRAVNGDLDGSASRMASAFQSAGTAFAGYNQRGGTPWGQDAWSSVVNRNQRASAAAGANLQIGGNGSMDLNRRPSQPAFRF